MLSKIEATWPLVVMASRNANRTTKHSISSFSYFLTLFAKLILCVSIASANFHSVSAAKYNGKVALSHIRNYKQLQSHARMQSSLFSLPFGSTTPPININNGGVTTAKKLMDSSDLKLEFCDKCDIYLGGLFPVHAPKYVRNKRKSTTTTTPPSLNTRLSSGGGGGGLNSDSYLNNEVDNDYVIYHTTSDMADGSITTATPVPFPSTTAPLNFDDFNDSLFFLNDINCGEVKKERGIQRLEAMLYAIDLINNDTELLPNLRLGARIYDTCDRDTIALEKCINFVSDYFVLNDENIVSDFTCVAAAPGSSLNPKSSFMIPQKSVDSIHKRKVIGVVGAASSSVSIQVANLLRLFQVSFSVT
jgi:hypothetical protein